MPDYSPQRHSPQRLLHIQRVGYKLGLRKCGAGHQQVVSAAGRVPQSQLNIAKNICGELDNDDVHTHFPIRLHPGDLGHPAGEQREPQGVVVAVRGDSVRS